MKTIFSLFILLLASFSLAGQHSDSHLYQDGIYYTMDDFLNHRVDSSSKVRKLNLELPTSKAFLDTLVDHVWFLDKNNDILKNTFAIVHKGEVYFQEKSMRKNIAEGYVHRSITSNPALHRIKVRGRYYYGEASYEIENGTEIAALTGMFGLVGGLAGAAIMSGSPKGMLLAPFVFDTKNKVFYVFVMRPKLREFMKAHHPDYTLELDDQRLDAEYVRNLFVQLNNEQ
jgi:hypothetical protein